MYKLINILVIAISMLVFTFEYYDSGQLFKNINLCSIIVFLVLVVVVHILKSVRLYLALYYSELKWSDFIKVYCKVTPVSVVLPFKIGDIFRMYCYGQLVGNLLRGVVITMLDRFMDTAALVTVIILTWFLAGGKMDLLVYLFVIFLIITCVIYFVYPGIVRIWRKSLLKSNATESRIAILGVLKKFDEIYKEIDGVTKGRGIILYILSILAWGIEIGSLYIISTINNTKQIDNDVFEYLRAALRGNKSLELKRFIMVTILLLMGVYIIIKILDTVNKKDIL
jgi:uncharacterised protein family (UPF0104)